MNYWIVPSNNNYYRLDDLLSVRTVVSWRQRQNFEVGDIIFIYSSAPISRLTYQMVVTGSNLSFSSYNDDREFWVDQKHYDEVVQNFKRFAEFRLVNNIPDNGKLSYEKLKQKGLNTIQITHRITGELLEYILSNLSNDTQNSIFPDTIDEISTFYEGATSKVLVNRYERSRDAREICIKRKGCKCSVCGMDFEKRYGTIGHGFIHIHHTTPISSIGKDYVINYEKDLVPVCPNCHAMLHRKNPPYMIEELKELIALSNKNTNQ